MMLEQLYAVSMMLLEITETCIFKHAIVLKVSALLHTEKRDFRGAPWLLGISQAHTELDVMGEFPLPGTVSLSICSKQKKSKFLLPSLKMLIQENKLFWQELVACERPVGKCPGAATKALLLHRDTEKREMGPWTSPCCCCVCLATAPSVTRWRGHFSFPFGQLILCEGADITKNQDYVVCCTNLSQT